MIYKLVALPRFSKYNLNFPLFYARTCRVIDLWCKGAHHHACGGSRFLPRQHKTNKKPHNWHNSRTDWSHAFKPDVWPVSHVNRWIVVNVPAHDMQALPALRSRSERYTSILIRCDPSDNLIWSLVAFAKRNQPGWPDDAATLRLLLVTLTGLYGCYCLKLLIKTLIRLIAINLKDISFFGIWINLNDCPHSCINPELSHNI